MSGLENEKELVLAALTDANSFAVIYDYYYPKVYNYIFMRVANPNITDDLVSQVFQKVLTKLGTYASEKGAFSAWLFTIASNTFKDYCRVQRRSFVSFSEEIDELVTIESDVEKEILLYEARDQLMKALRQLSVREQNIIALKFWGELRNRQIAEMLGLSESNVAVILFRALKRLRNILIKE